MQCRANLSPAVAQALKISTALVTTSNCHRTESDDKAPEEVAPAGVAAALPPALPASKHSAGFHHGTGSPFSEELAPSRALQAPAHAILGASPPSPTGTITRSSTAPAAAPMALEATARVRATSAGAALLGDDNHLFYTESPETGAAGVSSSPVLGSLPVGHKQPLCIATHHHASLYPMPDYASQPIAEDACTNAPYPVSLSPRPPLPHGVLHLASLTSLHHRRSQSNPCYDVDLGDGCGNSSPAAPPPAVWNSGAACSVGSAPLSDMQRRGLSPGGGSGASAGKAAGTSGSASPTYPVHVATVTHVVSARTRPAHRRAASSSCFESNSEVSLGISHGQKESVAHRPGLMSPQMGGRDAAQRGLSREKKSVALSGPVSPVAGAVGGDTATAAAAAATAATPIAPAGVTSHTLRSPDALAGGQSIFTSAKREREWERRRGIPAATLPVPSAAALGGGAAAKEVWAGGAPVVLMRRQSDSQLGRVREKGGTVERGAGIGEGMGGGNEEERARGIGGEMGGAMGGRMEGGMDDGVEGRVGQVVSEKDQQLVSDVKELQARGLPGSDGLVNLLDYLHTLGIELATIDATNTNTNTSATATATTTEETPTHFNRNRRSSSSNFISSPLGMQFATANANTTEAATTSAMGSSVSGSSNNLVGTTERFATVGRDLISGSGSINSHGMARNVSGEGATMHHPHPHPHPHPGRMEGASLDGLVWPELQEGEQ